MSDKAPSPTPAQKRAAVDGASDPTSVQCGGSPGQADRKPFNR